MLRTALTAIMIAGFVPSAMAIEVPKYDRKIEAAVKRIVAKKVGDIRGAFGVEAQPSVAFGEAFSTGDLGAETLPTEMRMVQVAALEVALRPGLISPEIYHSGRPEPSRTVRKVTSFQYF